MERESELKPSGTSAFCFSLILWIALGVVLAENFLLARRYDHRWLYYINAVMFVVVVGMILVLISRVMNVGILVRDAPDKSVNA